MRHVLLGAPGGIQPRGDEGRTPGPSDLSGRGDRHGVRRAGGRGGRARSLRSGIRQAGGVQPEAMKSAAAAQMTAMQLRAVAARWYHGSAAGAGRNGGGGSLGGAGG